VPGPTIGVTGASAVAAEHEARPEDHVLETGLPDGALHLPLCREVRHGVLRPLVEAERAREDEAPHSRILRRRDDVPRSTGHRALEVGRPSADDRNEVDDRVRSLAGCAEGRRIGHVPDSLLDRPRGEAPGACRLAHQSAHGELSRAQRVHDVRPDEPRPARHENSHSPSSKFCQ
jgi:hypothetical protein